MPLTSTVRHAFCVAAPPGLERSLRILLAEDNFFNQLLARKILEKRIDLASSF